MALDFYALARAAKWALEHPKFKPPKPYNEWAPGWMTWIERDETGKAIRICYAPTTADNYKL